MKIKHVAITGARLVLVWWLAAVAAGGNGRRAVVIFSTPWYGEPREGLLPSGYLDRLDTCRIDSTLVDSAAMPWFHFRAGGNAGWVRGESVRFVSLVSADSTRIPAGSDRDKKRRYAAVRAHPRWPRRFIRMIRKGRICLDMKEEHVRASWGPPAHRIEMFTLGIGRHRCWVYAAEDREPLIVTFSGGVVVGWSTGQ